MKKLLKVLHCICLSGAITFGAANKADAFFLIPPMPWDLEIDLPANAGKIVSEAKALVLQAKTIKSQLNTVTLTSLSGSLKKIGNIKKDKSTQKNPGKGLVSGNVAGTQLSESTDSEKDYFDAYYKLFYIYPAANNYQADKEKGEEGYQLLHAAYKNKAVEYRQDVTVDTYFTGLLTERYLVLVERTLKRLEECQNNINWSEARCTFFGLKMEEIKSVENPNEVEGEDNAGLMAQTKNAYIVSTVYDRLMRIVEDLTATEAIYEAAKQIDLVEPESDGEKESSAEKYLPQKYHFVSKDIEEKAYAKQSILSKKTKSSCFEGGGKNCPGYNKESAALDNMEDAQILHEIAEIKENLNKARDYHNLKVQMPKYKTKYRQYLIADIIHKRVYESLKNSEECAKTFFEEHENKDSLNPKYVWGNPGKSNEHEKREKNSISRMLIERYQSETTNKIIGGDMDCDGYYENCPIGYKKKTDEHCVVLGENGEVIREELNLHPCIVETVTKATDDEENTELAQLDAKRTDTADVIPDDDKEVPYDDSDFLKDATEADTLQKGGRIADETSWQIGREILEKLVEDKDIKFEKAWNDQKSFQEQYLRQKYGNIKSIIKSIDTAVNSYKLAQSAANDADYQADNEGVMDKLTQAMNAIASCVSVDEARDSAEDEFCNNSTEPYESCEVKGDVKNGIITGTKLIRYYDSEGKERTRTETKTWSQVASMNGTCDFKKEANVNVNIADSNNDSCNSNWDLSVGYLVRSYYNKYLGQCAAEKSEAMRDYAKNEKGRIVAQDKLYDVIKTRIEEDAKMKAMVDDHEQKINRLKYQMSSYKAQMNKYNEEIDLAAQKKNKAHQALKMSKQRVQSIEDEIKQIKARRSGCAAEYDIAKLEYEKAEINNEKVKWACPSSCNSLEESKRKAIGCDDNKAPESHLIGIDEFNEDNDSKFVKIDEANKNIELQVQIIKASEEQRNFIKEEIARLEKEIRDITDEFADKYVEDAERSQKVIEAKNGEFEAFMKEENGKQKKRMENKNRKGECKKSVPILGCIGGYYPKTYDEDDLTRTITQVFADNDNLEEVVKETINNEIVGDINLISSTLNGFGLPEKFVLDDTFDAIGVGAGFYTAVEFAKKVKDMIVDIAVEKVTTGITDADEKVNKAREDAIAALQETIGKNGINVCEACVLSDIDKDNITSQGYHGATIKQAHKKLIEKFRGIEEDAGIVGLFGIPDDADKDEDDEYFVALPARGTDYLGKQDYEKESLDGNKDSGAGRDYRVPRKPFLHQPPVREVFYYSAQDYEDTPKSKKKKKQKLYAPAIPYLLNRKYPDSSKTWEYMPEVWRYLLARPNLRTDRKYQQTFVERSLKMDVLKSILSNAHLGIWEASKSGEKYRTIIARGGTYPCQIGTQRYDMIGHDTDIKKIKFIYRNTTPLGIEKLQQCYDINLFNQRPCNTYEIHSSSICHLLSNHGRKENSSKNNKKYYEDYQKMSTDKKEQGMFANYSELGMLLQFDGNRLVYRKAQQYLNEALLSENYTENNIHRQKAEHASFKHNIFGSFLDNVNAEFNARKNLEKITEDVRSSFENICEVIHNQKEPVKDKYGNIIGETRRIVAGEDSIKDDCDEACLKEHNKQCAEILLFGEPKEKIAPFADSPEDRAYGVDGEYSDNSYAGVNCGPTAEYTKKNMYQSIFCQLDSWKKESLGAATIAFNNLMTNSEAVDRNKVSNELIDIMKEMAALNADEDEVTVVTANMDVDIQQTDMTKIGDVYRDITGTVGRYMENIIKTAKTDRTIERENDDLGIASMENQNQIIPYCPFYVYKHNYGL